MRLISFRVHHEGYLEGQQEQKLQPAKLMEGVNQEYAMVVFCYLK